MHSEMKYMCDLVLSARKALAEHTDFDFVPNEDVRYLKFTFLPENTGPDTYDTNSEDGWFAYCRDHGVTDIKYLIPTEVKDTDKPVLINTSQSAIVCYRADGKPTCFVPDLAFDSTIGGYAVFFTEVIPDNLPAGIPVFEDFAVEFQNILFNMEEMAKLLGFPEYAAAFRKANESIFAPETVDASVVPAALPEQFRGIYYAITKANVFGRTGSWNDAPCCAAYAKGMDIEYKGFSAELLRQLRNNLMYIVNESWK